MSNSNSVSVSLPRWAVVLIISTVLTGAGVFVGLMNNTSAEAHAANMSVQAISQKVHEVDKVKLSLDEHIKYSSQVQAIQYANIDKQLKAIQEELQEQRKLLLTLNK